MRITLREIDKTNYARCCDLKVSENQRNFVASNGWSLVESKFSGEALFPLAVYNNDEMVGFLMYGYYPASDEYPISSWWMVRLMIDERYQHKGFGEQALEALLLLMKEKLGDSYFYTSVEPSNCVATKLYEKHGFIKTGEVIGEEDVMRTHL